MIPPNPMETMSVIKMLEANSNRPADCIEYAQSGCPNVLDAFQMRSVREAVDEVVSPVPQQETNETKLGGPSLLDHVQDFIRGLKDGINE